MSTEDCDRTIVYNICGLDLEEIVQSFSVTFTKTIGHK